MSSLAPSAVRSRATAASTMCGSSPPRASNSTSRDTTAPGVRASNFSSVSELGDRSRTSPSTTAQVAWTPNECPATARSGFRRGSSSATARASAPSRIRSGMTDATPIFSSGRAVTGPTQNGVTVVVRTLVTASVRGKSLARIRNDAAAGADVNVIASTPPSATFSTRSSSAPRSAGGSQRYTGTPTTVAPRSARVSRKPGTGSQPSVAPCSCTATRFPSRSSAPRWASTSSEDSDTGDHSSRRPAVRSAPVALGPREIPRAFPKASSSASANPQLPAAATQPRKPIPVVAMRMSGGVAITFSVAARNRASSASGTIWIAAAVTMSAPRRRSIVANSSTRREAVMATVKPVSEDASGMFIPSLSIANRGAVTQSSIGVISATGVGQYGLLGDGGDARNPDINPPGDQRRNDVEHTEVPERDGGRPVGQIRGTQHQVDRHAAKATDRPRNADHGARHRARVVGPGPLVSVQRARRGLEDGRDHLVHRAVADSAEQEQDNESQHVQRHGGAGGVTARDRGGERQDPDAADHAGEGRQCH